MAKAKAPKPWRRETAGQYVSADERYVIDESAPGHWYVSDRDQPDELGQPRVSGPFASLVLAKSEADAARDVPTPVSPLAGRVSEGHERRRKGTTEAATASVRRRTPPATSPPPRASAAPRPTAPPEPVIRSATRGDAPGIARLWLGLAERLAAADPARFGRPSDDAFARSLPDHLADPGGDAATFVVALGDEPVAFAAVRLLHPSPYPERRIVAALDTVRAVVPAIAVDERHLRAGFERQLLARVEAWARERGASGISIDAAGAGLQATALYRGAGYEQAPPRYERALE